MSTKLPINLTDLLRQRIVNGESIEHMTGWIPDQISVPYAPLPTTSKTLAAVMW